MMTKPILFLSMDKFKKAKRIWAFIGLILAVVLFVGIDEYRIKQDKISERVVEIPLGAYTFEFPRNAIDNGHIGKESKRRSLTSLEFILPDLEPKTAENIDQFSAYNELTVNLSAMRYEKSFQREGEEPYTANKVDTSFEYDLTPMLERRLSAKFPDGTPRYSPLGKGKLMNGLMYYEHKGKNSGHIYTNAEGPVYLMLECSDEYWPNPMCSFDTNNQFLGHMSLHYHYPRKYIGQAIEIYEFVLSYLKSHFKGVTDYD